MNSISVTAITSLFMAGAMFAASQTPSPTEDENFQAVASKLLKEVQYRVSQLTTEAASLDSNMSRGISRESHGHRLSLLKDHINTIGQRLAMLHAIRDEAAPWQRQAIDSILPVALNVATHTEAAILHFNESGKPLWHPDYTGHVRAISDHSDEVKDIVDLHLAMAATADKLERLRERANNIDN
jgi:hypothetical protein